MMNYKDNKNEMIEFITIKVHPYSKHYTNGYFQELLDVIPYYSVMKC